jgi:hypothetical protein
MADTKISAETAATALGGTEVFPAVQGAANVKATSQQVKDFANKLDAPITLSANTTLGPTHYGRLVYVDTAAVTITFPAAPATNEVLDVYNGSTGAITVNGVAVGAGKFVSYVSINSAWKARQSAFAGGNTLFPKPYVSGDYYPMNPLFISANGVALAASKVHYIPFVPFADVTISELAAKVVTAAGTVAYMAIYDSRSYGTGQFAPTGLPIAQGSGSIDTSTTGAKTIALAANVNLSGGHLYFLAIISDGAPVFITNSLSWSGSMLGSSSLANVGAPASVRDGSTSTPGTWADQTSTFPSVTGIEFMTAFFRVA